MVKGRKRCVNHHLDFPQTKSFVLFFTILCSIYGRKNLISTFNVIVVSINIWFNRNEICMGKEEFSQIGSSGDDQLGELFLKIFHM